MFPRRNEMIHTLVFGVYHNLIGDRPWSPAIDIWEHQWDTLIVLDACRRDALAAVAPEYDWLPTHIQGVWSPASATWEWMDSVFHEGAPLEKTHYICGNPNSESHAPDRLGGLREVWRQKTEASIGGTPPFLITDHAIDYAREYNPERLIIHYVQPHFPSIDRVGFNDSSTKTAEEWNWDDPPTDRRERIWESYLNNLRYVLDSVALLRRNLDAPRTIITADHGNSFGEWGIWGHPERVPTPQLRRVPWVQIEATDEQTRLPEVEPLDGTQTSVTAKERLRELGYL